VKPNQPRHSRVLAARARSLSRRRGFIILFGSRSIVSNVPGPTVQTVCPRCAHHVAMQAKSYRTWFTLFFIPVFPVSGSTRFTECPNCRARFNVSPEELQARLARAGQQQNQQAIALYNSLRASPANSVTLNDLMQLYASMQEFDQAVAAARDFPKALNSSEQCMTTLGRVLLAQNRFPEAIQWFDAALARNPALGEAAYHKALAHMLTTPPEMDKSIAAARTARNAGYPNAEALLQEAEARARQ